MQTRFLLQGTTENMRWIKITKKYQIYQIFSALESSTACADMGKRAGGICPEKALDGPSQNMDVMDMQPAAKRRYGIVCDDPIRDAPVLSSYPPTRSKDLAGRDRRLNNLAQP